MPHLSILSRNFHLIELGVLEFNEVVAQVFQRLDARPGVEQAFVLVSPLLKLPDVLVQRWLALDEILLIIFLLETLA